MRAWTVLAMTVLLTACASKRTVPVDCDRRLVPINAPAVMADPVVDGRRGRRNHER
jgi:hypothetical protein